MSLEKRTRPSGRAPRLHEQIVDVLSDEIRSGGFPAAAHLTEEAVADRFSVSRGPVRNAFQQLERDGLLVKSEGRGYSVSDNIALTVEGASFPEPRPLTLDHVASWEGIYRDVAKVAVVHAAYGDWRVVESELAEAYCVSRTVAREVLAHLEGRGIVRKDTRVRWHLPKLDERRVENLYEMRSILEPVALEQAVKRAPPNLLLEMRDELIRASSVSELLPPSEFDRLEQRLHVHLLSFARNDLLRDALQHCHALLFTNASVYRATRSKFGRDPFPGEHLEILDRVLDDRIPEARETMHEHMRLSLARALDRLAYMNRHIPLENVTYLQRIDVMRSR